MIAPSTVRGFDIGVPSFPYFKGMRLMPFAVNLANAVNERAAMSIETYDKTVDLPELSHLLVTSSGSFAGKIDEAINRMCNYFVNPYEITDILCPSWTFRALAEKACEVLDIQTSEVPLSRTYTGHTLGWMWAIHRATMLSLLSRKLLNCNDRRISGSTLQEGHYEVSTLSSGSGSARYVEGLGKFSEAYQHAVSNGVSGSYTYSDGAVWADLSELVYFWESDYYVRTSCEFRYITGIKYIAENGYTNLLDADFVFCLGAMPYPLPQSQYATFDNHGSPLQQGVNVIPVTLGADGTFYSNPLPRPVSAYEEGKWGWDGHYYDGDGNLSYAMGLLLGDYTNHFQYQLIFSEEQEEED